MSPILQQSSTACLNRFPAFFVCPIDFSLFHFLLLPFPCHVSSLYYIETQIDQTIRSHYDCKTKRPDYSFFSLLNHRVRISTYNLFD